MGPVISVLPAHLEDAPELAGLINAVIAKGGTTAYEDPHSPESFAGYFLTQASFISLFKAVDDSGVIIGFQSLEFSDELPDSWGDIATFSKIGGVQKGIGTALFSATVAHARKHKVPVINATIRADNTGGLAYYAKLGFVDYALKRAVPLKDGTQVDRILKKFEP